MSGFHFQAVLFDLDGTLVDTLPDIAAAMNSALTELQLRPLQPAMIGSFVGNGPRVLARRVLEAQPISDDEARERLIDVLLATYVRHYETQIGKLGAAFPGVVDCLRELSARGLKLAVVTNALQHLAEAILDRFGIAPYLDLVLGGDRVVRHKPHPEPLLQACRTFDVAPQAALMVGDSINDVQAARAAGCPVVAVPYGYNGGAPASALECNIVENFTLLQAWMAGYERRSLLPVAPQVAEADISSHAYTINSH
jgi:phosphoglycolate phosphatase